MSVLSTPIMTVGSHIKPLYFIMFQDKRDSEPTNTEALTNEDMTTVDTATTLQPGKDHRLIHII